MDDETYGIVCIVLLYELTLLAVPQSPQGSSRHHKGSVEAFVGSSTPTSTATTAKCVSALSIRPDWRYTLPGTEHSSPLVLLVIAVVDDPRTIHIGQSASRLELCAGRLHRRRIAPSASVYLCASPAQYLTHAWARASRRPGAANLLEWRGGVIQSSQSQSRGESLVKRTYVPVNFFFGCRCVACVERTMLGDGTLTHAHGLCHGGYRHPQDVLQSRSWVRRWTKCEVLCIA